jgi:hypothetical protein
MEGSKFDDLWNVSCLVDFGRRKKIIIFTCFCFLSHKILFKPFFPLILRFCFIVVLNHYFTSFIHFIRPINYNNASWGTKFSTHSLSSWFWLKIFSFFWIHGVMHDYVLWASNCTNEWKTALGIVLIFKTNLTPSWWKSWTSRSVLLS